MTATDETILLVDDEQDLLMVISFHLQKAGYTVVLAENGEEALERARQHQPVLAVIDRMLPRMDGLELARRLRVLQPQIMLVMLTALGSNEDRISGLETGMDDYVVKPVNPQELVLRVKAVLRRRRPAPANPVIGSDDITKPQPAHIRPAQSAPAPQADPVTQLKASENNHSVQTTISRNLESLLKTASEAAQNHNYIRARELYLYVLSLDRANESALLWLAWHTNDPYEGVNYLERLVAAHPDNQRLRDFLAAGRKRCQDLDSLISGSSVVGYWNIAEQVHQDTSRRQANGQSAPVTPLGQLLLAKGFVTPEQLETAVSLHEMFNRLGTPKKLGEVLLEYDYLSKDQLQQALREQQGRREEVRG